MKNLLLLLVTGFCLNISASAQCKELKEKKDAFSNKAERTARVIIGGGGTKWSVDINQAGSDAYMKWGIAMPGEFNQRFEKGTPLLLKLSNGDVLKLQTSEASSPVTQAASGGAGTVNIFTVYYLKFELPKDVLTKLSNAIITDLKVDVPGQEIKSPKTKEKQMEKMQNIFGCMLNS